MQTNKGVACAGLVIVLKMSLVKAQPEARKLKFVLPPDVKFGYHK